MVNILRYSIRLFILIFAALIFNSLFPLPVEALEKTITISIGMEFVLIPGGTFKMGSPQDEPNRREMEIEHQVTISKPFYMQTTEVTLQQWRAIMGERFFFKKKGTDHMPVVKISWQDCIDFIEKLNALNEGVYRLPTEAEWEYACRAGTSSAYAWGETIDCKDAMYGNNTLKMDVCEDYVKSKGLQVDQPASVKSYKPNAWGLYDMEGNVWEWCQDWYGSYGEDAVVDPRGPASGTDKVRRGGSWYGPGERCRCANRNLSNPANKYQTTGFRLVRVAE
jgi:formylglycine-generating enzyme